MEKKMAVLLEEDLKMDFVPRTAGVKHVEYSECYKNLIKSWIERQSKQGPVLASDFVLFKNYLKSMLIAEIDMIKGTPQLKGAGIWLIDKIE